MICLTCFGVSLPKSEKALDSGKVDGHQASLKKSENPEMNMD